MTSPAPDFDRREAWVDLLARLTDGFVRSIPPGGSPAAARLPGAPPNEFRWGSSRMVGFEP